MPVGGYSTSSTPFWSEVPRWEWYWRTSDRKDDTALDTLASVQVVESSSVTPAPEEHADQPVDGVRLLACARDEPRPQDLATDPVAKGVDRERQLGCLDGVLGHGGRDLDTLTALVRHPLSAECLAVERWRRVTGELGAEVGRRLVRHGGEGEGLGDEPCHQAGELHPSGAGNYVHRGHEHERLLLTFRDPSLDVLDSGAEDSAFDRLTCRVDP